jgi:hypothetical protein
MPQSAVMDRQDAIEPLKMTLCQTNALTWNNVMTAVHPSVRPIDRPTDRPTDEMFRLIIDKLRVEIHQPKKGAQKCKLLWNNVY